MSYFQRIEKSILILSNLKFTNNLISFDVKILNLAYWYLAMIQFVLKRKKL